MKRLMKMNLPLTFILILCAMAVLMLWPGEVKAKPVKVGDLYVDGGTLGQDYHYDPGRRVLTILKGTSLTISGKTTADKIVVEADVKANIILDSLKIDVSNRYDNCAFAIKPGAHVMLELAKGSDNHLTSGPDCAGLNVPRDAGVTINKNTSNPGSLTAMCKSDGVYSSSCGAGIGGNDEEHGGTVNIYGGTITAISNGKDKGAYGAGIGGGRMGDGGIVTIHDGHVTASCTSDNTAHGAGIGIGWNGDGGTVTIKGGNVTASCAVSSYNDARGAGIGGGSSGSVESVNISGGTVTANCTGGESASGAGIGSGWSGEGSSVSISGGIVMASCKSNKSASGAGIGGGYRGAGGNVIINGGSVHAIGSADAQDIGHGESNTEPGTLKNGSGADVYRTIITGLPADTPVFAADSPSPAGYGLKDVKTDGEGKLYFYLPADDIDTENTEARFQAINPGDFTTVSLKKENQNGEEVTGDLWVKRVGRNESNTLKIGKKDAALTFGDMEFIYNGNPQAPNLKREDHSVELAAAFYKGSTEGSVWSAQNQNIDVGTGYAIMPKAMWKAANMDKKS